MNREFKDLTPTQQTAVKNAIRSVLANPELGPRSEMMSDGSEAYAYPASRGTPWGINARDDGCCIARGVWPEGQALCPPILTSNTSSGRSPERNWPAVWKRKNQND